VARYWSISAVPVSAHPPPLVITTKLAAAIYGGVDNDKYKYSIQYCPCDEDSMLEANTKDKPKATDGKVATCKNLFKPFVVH